MTESQTAALDAALLRRMVEDALREDHAWEDVTTSALVPPEQKGFAVIGAKAEGVIAGLPLAQTAFELIDTSLSWRPEREDGSAVTRGDRVAVIEGSMNSILRAERVALNYLSHLSGIATSAREIVKEIEGTECRLRDTRKTIPGLRLVEKYATRMGGAVNHRMDLSDGILIKDNHLIAVRTRGLTITDSIRLARDAHPGMRIEVEVTVLEEAGEAIDAGADELLLDNMPPAEMREVVRVAVEAIKRPVLEASGGITVRNAREIADTGVDFISVGALTHSAPALDLSLELET